MIRTPVTWFELGRLLYESRAREIDDNDPDNTWLRLHPYPTEPTPLVAETCSFEIELAQAQAKALLKQCYVEKDAE